jgi:transcriptional repressor NrdR
MVAYGIGYLLAKTTVLRKEEKLRCPFCQHMDDRVIDSRLSKEGDMIRRRRECTHCLRRFTTYERVEETLPLVIKKDGRRENFDRGKILAGLHKACEKRPIGVETLEKLVDRIEQKLQEGGEREIHSRVVGEQIMLELQNLDEVAYVRFASVYRSFKDVNEFMSEVKELLEKGQKKKD